MNIVKLQYFIYMKKSRAEQSRYHYTEKEKNGRKEQGIIIQLMGIAVLRHLRGHGLLNY